MVSEYADIKKDGKTSFIVTISFIAVMVIAAFALTAGKGLDDPNFVSRFILYAILGTVGIAYVILVALYNVSAKKRVLKVIIHDPEESIIGKFKVVRNPLLLGLVTLDIFTIPLFYAGKYSNTFFSGISFTRQQITTFSNLWANSAFPLNENWLFLVPISLLYTWNWKANRKSNIVLFWAINLIGIPVLMAVGWMLFHNAVYGSDEAALLSTFIFGGISVMLTMLTVSVIPWLILHFLTDFMLALKKFGLMSSDTIAFAVFAFEILFIILTIIVWRWDKKKAKA